MNLLNYLKNKKAQLIKAKEEPLTAQNDEINNIEIVIENNNGLFENEQEIIRKGAQTFLENGAVDNIEDGIIVFATMIRGLKYKTIEKDENGNIKIILKDISLDNSINKKL